jgi:hypothetical protein
VHGLRQDVVAGDREKVGGGSSGAIGDGRPSVGRAEDSDGVASMGAAQRV